MPRRNAIVWLLALLKKARVNWYIVLVIASCLSGYAAQAQAPLRYEDWRLHWSEEFAEAGDSTSLMPQWRFDYPWGRTINQYEGEYYTGDALRIQGGQLLLTAKRLAQPRTYRGKQLIYESGMLYGQQPGAADSLRPAPCDPASSGLTFGLFEIRCRLPRDNNSFPAFWLFGTADEIDIFEGSLNAFSNNTINRNHNYWRAGMAASEGCACYFFNTSRRSLSQEFHTYSLSWLPGELIFYFDGHPIRRETRYLPLHCSMALIANLAIPIWSSAMADTMAIEYLRVYQPRRLPAGSVVQRPGGTLPLFDLAWLPFNEYPGQADPTPRQHWQATADAQGHLRLALLDNLNPACSAQFSLPAADSIGWSPPWVIQYGSPALRLTLSQEVPTEWTLYNQLNRKVKAGIVPAGAEWRPSWPALLPGAYRLRLRQGAAETVHPVIVLGRPPTLTPTAEWLQPVAAPAETP